MLSGIAHRRRSTPTRRKGKSTPGRGRERGKGLDRRKRAAERGKSEARPRAPTVRARRLGDMRRTWKVGIALGHRITTRRAGLAAGTTAKEPPGGTANETLVLIIDERVLRRYIQPKIELHHPHFLVLSVLLDHVRGHLVQVSEGLDGDPLALPVRLNLLHVDDGAAARRHRRARVPHLVEDRVHGAVFHRALDRLELADPVELLHVVPHLGQLLLQRLDGPRAGEDDVPDPEGTRDAERGADAGLGEDVPGDIRDGLKGRRGSRERRGRGGERGESGSGCGLERVG
mmetsp:Transcript_9787/g.39660  ORF Transcript_9787/g.39660 Transcript_9787/m.39660 type:complete len:287 (+) Transcript_9787:303-1163(+)